MNADGDGPVSDRSSGDRPGAGETNTDATTAPTDEESSEKAFDPAASAGIFLLYAVTVLAGLALLGPFQAAGLQAFEDPSSLGNVGLVLAEVLVATALFLVAFRYDLDLVVRLVVVGAYAYVVRYPVQVLAAGLPGPAVVPVALGAVVGLAAAAVLWVYPEWYVLNAGAVAFGAAAVALFGISLSPLPVLVLLTAMAAYDAYSVYVSEHMQSLGSGIVDLKLPMVFVVPVRRSFSLREADDLESLADGAMLLGLGDAIFPGLLAASAAVFVDAPALVAGLNAPAVGALVGGLVGMVVLKYLLFAVRRTHAGLPALNGGVIAGYVLGALAAGVPLVEALGLGPYL